MTGSAGTVGRFARQRLGALLVVWLTLTACGSTAGLTGQRAAPASGGLPAVGSAADGLGTQAPGRAAAGRGASVSVVGSDRGSPTASEAGVVGGGPAPRAVGGSAPRSPLEIGLLIVDTAGYTRATGVGVSQSSFYKASVHAFVDDLNATGGVAGRKLALVDATIEVTAPDLGSQFQAACVRFTQDHHVGAVVYDGVLYYQSFNACLTRAQVPLLFMGMAGGSAIGDTTDLAANPGMIGVDSVSIDRALESVLTKSLAAGFLRRGSALGVFVEDCPYNLRAYQRTLAPLAARAALSIVRVDTGCAQAASDQGQVVSSLQGAALKFRTAGVDTVLFVTAFENGYLYYFAEGAESQGYAPQYLLFRQQGSPDAMGQYPKDQLLRMRGFGGMPLSDLTRPPAPPPAQAAVRATCLSTAKRHGIAPSSDDLQRQWFFTACDAVSLLRRALVLSGGQGGTQRLVAAVEQLGSQFVSALDLSGTTRFGPGRHDGMELTAVSVYQPSCGCFTYVSRPSPIV